MLHISSCYLLPTYILILSDYQSNVLNIYTHNFNCCALVLPSGHQ